MQQLGFKVHGDMLILGAHNPNGHPSTATFRHCEQGILGLDAEYTIKLNHYVNKIYSRMDAQRSILGSNKLYE